MKKINHTCDLKSCFLCKRCLPEWLPAVDANRKTFYYKKGELIFREGEEVKGIYFVYSGKVKVHKKWGEEKELIIRFAQKGDILGHRGLGHHVVQYPISATAIEPVQVCYIDLDFFQSTLKINYEFIYQLLLFFADELQDSERKMRNLAHMQVKGRIAQALVALRDKFGTTAGGLIDVSLSRQDLASFAGTTYETVFRIINEFTEEQMIRTEGKNIAILNADKLLELTKETEP
ncbi:MAG: Crp/Fnr family transcriptional regulator [Chitinophagaceae bacterium]|nr:Crp/Fnr family transcriptional regulator [Chitinophagaceae bacterium]